MFQVRAQELFIGLGSEINQTRFRQNAPEIKVNFSNPHKPEFGLNIHAIIGLEYKSKYKLTLKPGISILRSKSDVTSGTKATYISVPLELGYSFTKRFLMSLGVEYNYLTKLKVHFNGNSGDLTFFANHRHFINPTLSFAFYLNKNWTTYLRAVYFTRDLFNSGALDDDDNIVGPVMVTPYTFGIGINYRFVIN